MGLALTPDRGGSDDTTLRLINQGAYDLAIHELVYGLAWLDRPTFLRIGYEFNGRWNNYSAGEYVRAWHRIEDALSQLPTTRNRTALVWDYVGLH